MHIFNLLGQEDPFADIMHMQGLVYRDVRGRRTIQVELAGSKYFIKQHFGVGWGEIFKNLFSLKMPILGAMTEVDAIKKLGEIGIATTPLVGYGVKGNNPATQQSFVMTEDLGDIISLEELCVDWKQNPPDSAFRNGLIIEIAKLAARLHGAGLCHRDFYLCHLVMKKSELAEGKINLILIDLHRMLTDQPTGGSAAMKDIAGLYFSAIDCGFNTQDWALFRRYYLPHSDAFWHQVVQRADKLYIKFYSQKFQQRLVNERAKLETDN